MDEQERAGEVESLFRSVNERVRELNQKLEPVVDYGSWACECADPSCVERIDMTNVEYTAVRSDPKHFAVAPADKHVNAAVECLIRKEQRYWVVEKRGEAAEIALQTYEPPVA